MRVLHLSEQFSPSTAPWLMNIIRNTPNTEPVLSAWYNVGIDQLADEFTILKFPRQQYYSGEKIFKKPYRRVIRSAYKSIYNKKIAAQAENVDLVHAHFATVGYNNLQIAKALQVPMIVSFYGYDYESIIFQDPKWKDHYQELFGSVDLVLAEGPFGAEKLVELGCPKERVKVVELGVNLENINTIKRKKNPGELSLVQVAPYTEKKGHIYSIQACHQLKEQCSNINMTFIGPGDNEGLKKEVQRLGLNEHITFQDGVNYDKLHSTLADYQVFIHPSCYAANRDCEGGAPIVLIDAQATGMPVISTTHCDIPNEVIHGRTGLLSEEKNVDDLAQSIKRFYEMEQDEYDQFSSKAVDHIGKHYSSQGCGEKMREIYSSLVTN